MKIHTILKATQGRLVTGSPACDVDPARICTDTRTIRPGDTFLAISGASFDGNAFADEAFRKGAAGAIVSRDIVPPQGRFVVKVKNTTKALQDIASCHRMTFRIPVIAVTGSNGKTTVKEMIAAVLGAKHAVLRNEGTKNNHIGVPQTLLKLTRDHAFCVLEFGTNHPGEIALLGRIARPTAAVMTNIGPSHLAFLGDLAGVFREKKHILTTFDGRVTAAAFVNGDDPFLSRIRERGFRVQKYGFGPGNDVRCQVMASRHGRMRFRVNGAIDFELGLLGKHNISNALAAIAVGLHFKIKPALMRQALASCKPASMRLDLKKVNGFHVINDSYNSNPVSMERAIDVVRDFPAAAKWIVSADMLELGRRGAALHKTIGALVARSHIDGLVTFGELSRHTRAGAAQGGMRRDALWHCSTHDQVASILKRLVRAGDVVLLKGSRSMKMEEVLRRLEQSIDHSP